MRSTTNLGLTQFDGSDVPNWLEQYNTDMKKIDDNAGTQNLTNTEYENRLVADEKKIKDNRNQIDENTQDIANIKSDISNITGGSTVNINQLNTTVTAQGNEIESLDTRAGTLENEVTALETQVGRGEIENVGDSITGAIGHTAINFRGVTTGGISNIIETIATFIGSEDLPTIGVSTPTSIVNAIKLIANLSGVTVEEVSTEDISVSLGIPNNGAGNATLAVVKNTGLKITVGNNIYYIVTGTFNINVTGNVTFNANSPVAIVTLGEGIGKTSIFAGICNNVSPASQYPLTFNNSGFQNQLRTLNNITFASNVGNIQYNYFAFMKK